MLRGRDHKTKQALIDYLNKDTDERFWQAINNFGGKHGLCGSYLMTSTERLSPDGDIEMKDLFYQESDELFEESND